MDKKLNVLYFSATDGTLKVVKGVVEGIGSHFKEYNITLAENRQDAISFDADDLLIIGVPVYAGRVPEFLNDFFMNVKGNNTPAVFITVYGNRHYDDALIELKDRFEGNGFIGVAAGAFIAEHSYTSKVGTNRPDQKDLELANQFGKNIKSKLESNTELIQLHPLFVNGNFPYKERKFSPPMTPDTSDVCISCGICAKHCPMGAINFDNFKEIDPSKCVHCCSCIKRCPVNAKSMNHEMILKITNGLIDNFSAIRNEPEFFL